MPSLLPPSTATTANDTTTGAVKSIPWALPLTTTPIAAVNDHPHHCHTVDDDDRQKPAVFVCCQWQQSRSSSMEAAVNDDPGNGGLHQWWSLLTEAMVGWRDNDAMALSTMACSANGGGGNGGGHRQLCSSSWCRRHHPFIGIDGGSKDAIATSAINCLFH
jgi:hypothetical protein